MFGHVRAAPFAVGLVVVNVGRGPAPISACSTVPIAAATTQCAQGCFRPIVANFGQS